MLCTAVSLVLLHVWAMQQVLGVKSLFVFVLSVVTPVFVFFMYVCFFVCYLFFFSLSFVFLPVYGYISDFCVCD